MHVVFVLVHFLRGCITGKILSLLDNRVLGLVPNDTRILPRILTNENYEENGTLVSQNLNQVEHTVCALQNISTVDYYGIDNYLFFFFFFWR